MPAETQELLTFAAPVEITAAAGETSGPRVEINPAYTGGEIRVAGLPLPVMVDLAGMLIPEDVPLCRDHSTKTEDLLGTLEATNSGHMLKAVGHMNDSKAAAEIIRLWRSKQKLQASIGAAGKRRMLKPGETVEVNGRTVVAGGQGLILIEEARLREISIVGIGADADTNVSIEAAAKEGGKEKTIMEPTNEQTDIIQAERTRIKEISEITDSQRGRVADDVLENLQASAINDGLTVDQFCRNLLGEVRAARPAAPNVQTRREPRRDRQNVQVLEAGALQYYGFHTEAEDAYDEQTLQAAADLGIRHSMDLAAYACRMSTSSVPSDRDEMVNAAFSTSTLSEAVQGATTNVLIGAYRGVPSHWRSIAGRRSVPDFHEHKGVRPYHKDGVFEEVGADGEIRHTALEESVYGYQATTFAKMFGVTRKTIINDSIGAVFELQRELGRNAGRTVNDEFWKLIRSGVTANFFHTSKKNYVTGADTALSVAGLSRAIRAMREQTDEDKKPIDVEIGVLAVPPALESTARALLKSVELNQADDDGPTANPWNNAAELVIDPRLGAAAGGSDKAWYLFAKPATVPAVLAAFLDGKDLPTVERIDTPANILGQQFRAYIDFGFAWADPRGAVKSKGEA